MNHHHLRGTLSACGACATEWKWGSGSWGLGRVYWTGNARGQRWDRARRQRLAVARAESRAPAGREASRRHGSAEVWGPLGSRDGTGGRASMAAEAGRSKGKKGATSGGRIERRSPQPEREPEGGAEVEARQPSREELRRAEEEQLNSTWREAGLGDRRAGGRFRPERGRAPQREAQRVGGWGRDKSLQRVVTPEQLREEQEKRRAKAAAPPVKKKQEKPFADFDRDPRVRHPPEYYKYGPYGPYSRKGMPLGEPVEGTVATNNVVFFSSAADVAEVEERRRANVTVDYTTLVDGFDETDVGIQYLYVFARRRFGPRPDPWQDWTLVAQIAAESGDAALARDPEGFRKMGTRTQDIVTECVAWARPDLVYVKRPIFQLRLEPQEEFLTELARLLDPESDDGADSYYEKLCRLAGVDVGADARSVRDAFEALDEERQMECLKHVFTAHPVKVLSSARYDAHLWQARGEESGDELISSELSSDSVGAESDDDGDDRMPEEDGDGDGDGDGEVTRSGERWGLRISDEDDSPRDRAAIKDRRGRRRGRNKGVNHKPALRSAARPYCYGNVIEEIAQLRGFLCQQPLLAIGASEWIA